MIKNILITFMLIGSLQVNASMVIQKTVSDKDLASFTVTNKNKKLSFKVYFDSELEDVASQAIPTLENIYLNLAFNAGLDPSSITWAEVAFVVDKNYIPPRTNGLVRWTIAHPKANQLSKEVLEKLYTYISHEQTHAIQRVMSCGTPRWFEEGQAMWNELKVTKPWNIQIEKDERLRYETAFQSLKGELKLANWGGVKVKPEAIERQMTDEQKQKRKDDPTYVPTGPFSFGPDDLISDESNAEARYFVSLTIFEHLENKLGIEKLKQLFNDVYQMESCESDVLQAFINTKYQVDISDFFEKTVDTD